MFDYEQTHATEYARGLVKNYCSKVCKYENMRSHAPAPPAQVPWGLQRRLRAARAAADVARSRARLYDVLRITSVTEPVPQDFINHRKTQTLLEDVLNHRAEGGNKVRQK